MTNGSRNLQAQVYWSLATKLRTVARHMVIFELNGADCWCRNIVLGRCDEWLRSRRNRSKSQICKHRKSDWGFVALLCIPTASYFYHYFNTCSISITNIIKLCWCYVIVFICLCFPFHFKHIQDNCSCHFLSIYNNEHRGFWLKPETRCGAMRRAKQTVGVLNWMACCRCELSSRKKQ